PKAVAFGDDMTPEDFTAWMIAENPPPPPEPPNGDDPCYPPGHLEKCWDRKYLRVAFNVMGRFARAEINWKELQAMSVAKIADRIKPCPEGDKREAVVAAATVSDS
ncbi:MAG: hypothetical protein MI919_38330, partial [Holophagales bacterium]|nr:hypothetical protein [Holophagales bacterium]